MILSCEQRYIMRETTMAVSFKGAHFPPEVILMGVRWYVAYPLSTHHVEALMEERRVEVDHSTINRWVITYSPQLEEAFHRRKRPMWVSWRMDETSYSQNIRTRLSTGGYAPCHRYTSTCLLASRHGYSPAIWMVTTTGE